MTSDVLRSDRDTRRRTEACAPRCADTSRKLSAELLVLDAVGLIGAGAEFLLASCFVLAEVSFEPADMAVALERQHVRGDTVEEPAIVGDHDGATGK